ncbi:MAG: lysophospholipid acyltransferase family protein [Planctomycetota bacterium]
MLQLAAWITLGVLALLGVLVVGIWGRQVLNNPKDGEFDAGVLFWLARRYNTWVHALRIRGRHNIPKERTPGPLIVVSNHTAGLDPVIIQADCPFFIRWMMAKDMRAPVLEWFWTYWKIIFVNRENADGQSVREAVRELKEGGVIGIFPEGALERPPRQVLPFQDGIGLIIRRSKARVLPVVVDGTPQFNPAWASLWKPSQSIVRFYPVIDYADSGMSAKEIADDLRQRYLDWTGWPANERTDAWHEETGPGPKSGTPVPFVDHNEPVAVDADDPRAAVNYKTPTRDSVRIEPQDSEPTATTAE